MTERADSTGSFLRGVRVVEIADELGEYCGKVLAGLGADVIKVEPLGGERTRGYAPFQNDRPHPNRSLHFWHYNFGKRSVVLDLDSDGGRDRFRALARTADVVLDTRHRNYLGDRDLGYEQLRAENSGLVYVRMSPFGDDGPWADYHASDLVHLALGGVMMNCGYDATPTGEYDTPPIAPQMWHAYHIAGEITAIQIIAALIYRDETGIGQKLSNSVHESVSSNTETDMPDWVYSRLPHARQTCRHSFAQATASAEESATANVRVPGIARTKDGRWLLPYSTYLPGFGAPFEKTLGVLRKYGAERDLDNPRFHDPAELQKPDVLRHVQSVIHGMVGGYTYDRDVWKDAQANGLPWAPVRRPEENVGEDHWLSRGTFMDVEYPELGQNFTQIGAKWVSPGLPWRTGPRAPMVGEHTEEVFAALTGIEPSVAPIQIPRSEAVLSRHGKPFALQGVRIVDLSWLLASAGAGRFFTALGAEVIKVEHHSKVDGMRMGAGKVGAGGRAARDAATGPVSTDTGSGLDRSGAFMEINAGKRSVSLNLKSERGRELLTELLRDADMVIEGFSPGTMDRMGFGWERLKEINPRLVYVQQSGMGQIGTYGEMRSFGPTAQAFSGLSDMSGLPEPYAPAGIGYSYLDWFGAYQMALAMMSGLYRQRRTGKGCWIDSSQTEAGLYLTGTAILDYSVNGRQWQRFGNRSPYMPAAPHGAYRTAGDDRWIAIAASTEDHWRALLEVLDTPGWAADEKLLTLELRIQHQDYLDSLIDAATRAYEPFELMDELQRAGVPAGVCQTAEDRYERDPQLRHLNWMVELTQSAIGTWPVKDIPVTFSETPTFIGGILDRHGPSYGEDNDYVYRDLLGLDDTQIAELAEHGVL
ncbi:CaiB/BaiF CoA transferase family protein [Rhodococcus artemisiae]|uniref:CoA transferase n=1 Tax=Rhodococcus artemisiae TaxID=714159 RepID=A0ABU7LC94_9NOCA|nr:CoA transferase [Rhodococcus artemisiae]MEE2059140.1 CoA transferase [Rhodococcus artemisiae]